MRSSLLPRRQQVGRICDACRQQQKQQQQRNVASLSFLASIPPQCAAGPASNRPRAQQQQQRQCRQLNPQKQFAQSIHHHHNRGLHSSSSTTTSGGSGAAATTTAAEEREDNKNDSDNKNPTETTTETTTKPPTHYDLFPKTLPLGPPPAGPFRVDVRALRREYLALQATAHPDRHPPHLKARAEARSARVNEAFATLASPLRRAAYVLELRRAGAHADEAAGLDDPELLGAVLEARERVEEARGEGELGALRGQNEARIRESEGALERAFARDDLEAAGAEVVRLRYWVGIKESIDNWERGKPVVLEH